MNYTKCGDSQSDKKFLRKRKISFYLYLPKLFVKDSLRIFFNACYPYISRSTTLDSELRRVSRDAMTHKLLTPKHA